MRFLIVVSLPMLLALTVPVGAQTHAHPATPAPKATTSVAAQRWKTDPPLREGMGRIRAAVDALQHYEHGHMGPDQAVQLAAGIEKDVAFIVANCQLEPKADAALHPILGTFMQGAQALKTKPTDLTAIPPLRGALQDYARLFDDPGLSTQESEASR